MSKKVFFDRCAGTAYVAMFLDRGWERTYVMDEADLVQFSGGSDVSPHLYGEKSHPRTFSQVSRDKEEKTLHTMAVNKGIPCAGICRGGQLLNVLSGGKMFQHIDGHTQDHTILDLDTQQTIHATSTHHQMMIPGEGAEVVAIAAPKRTLFRENMANKQLSRHPTRNEDRDYEVLYYEETNSLCFQPHPEFFSCNPKLTEYYFKLLAKYLEV